MPFTEENYENSVIELFKDLGYTHVYGPDIERDYNSPLYESELVTALYRINPKLPEDAIQDALFKLHNFENAELAQRNRSTVLRERGRTVNNSIPYRLPKQSEKLVHSC